MAVIVPTDNGTRVAYVGKVIATAEQNLAHDSYFTAYVWENGEIIEVSDGSTAYGGPCATAKVDATSDVVNAVVSMLVRDVKAAMVGNHYRDMSPRVGMRVRSLTSRGKACGVVGEIVGEGEGTYGPVFKVKDDATGRVVIVSRNKVSALDIGVLDKECLALHVALGMLRKSGDGIMISGYAKDPKGYVAELVKEAKEAMIKNLVHYANAQELMNDFRQEGNVHAFALAKRLV